MAWRRSQRTRLGGTKAGMRCRRLQGGDSGSDVDLGVVENMLNRLDSSSHRRHSYIADHSLSRCMGNRVPSNRNQRVFNENRSTLEGSSKHTSVLHHGQVKKSDRLDLKLSVCLTGKILCGAKFRSFCSHWFQEKAYHKVKGAFLVEKVGRHRWTGTSRRTANGETERETRMYSQRNFFFFLLKSRLHSHFRVFFFFWVLKGRLTK